MRFVCYILLFLQNVDLSKKIINISFLWNCIIVKLLKIGTLGITTVIIPPGIYAEGYIVFVFPFICSFIHPFMIPSRSWNYFKVLR